MRASSLRIPSSDYHWNAEVEQVKCRFIRYAVSLLSMLPSCHTYRASEGQLTDIMGNGSDLQSPHFAVIFWDSTLN
jgi:hypothetical protein